MQLSCISNVNISKCSCVCYNSVRGQTFLFSHSQCVYATILINICKTDQILCFTCSDSVEACHEIMTMQHAGDHAKVTVLWLLVKTCVCGDITYFTKHWIACARNHHCTVEKIIVYYMLLWVGLHAPLLYIIQFYSLYLHNNDSIVKPVQSFASLLPATEVCEQSRPLLVNVHAFFGTALHPQILVWMIS